MINSKNPRSNFTKPITNLDYFLQRYSPEKMSDLKKKQLVELLKEISYEKSKFNDYEKKILMNIISQKFFYNLVNGNINFFDLLYDYLGIDIEKIENETNETLKEQIKKIKYLSKKTNNKKSAFQFNQMDKETENIIRDLVKSTKSHLKENNLKELRSIDDVELLLKIFKIIYNIRYFFIVIRINNLSNEDMMLQLRNDFFDLLDRLSIYRNKTFKRSMNRNNKKIGNLPNSITNNIFNLVGPPYANAARYKNNLSKRKQLRRNNSPYLNYINTSEYKLLDNLVTKKYITAENFRKDLIQRIIGMFAGLIKVFNNISNSFLVTDNKPIYDWINKYCKLFIFIVNSLLEINIINLKEYIESGNAFTFEQKINFNVKRPEFSVWASFPFNLYEIMAKTPSGTSCGWGEIDVDRIRSSPYVRTTFDGKEIINDGYVYKNSSTPFIMIVKNDKGRWVILGPKQPDGDSIYWRAMCENPPPPKDYMIPELNFSNYNSVYDNTNGNDNNNDKIEENKYIITGKVLWKSLRTPDKKLESELEWKRNCNAIGKEIKFEGLIKEFKGFSTTNNYDTALAKYLTDINMQNINKSIKNNQKINKKISLLGKSLKNYEKLKNNGKLQNTTPLTTTLTTDPMNTPTATPTAASTATPTAPTSAPTTTPTSTPTSTPTTRPTATPTAPTPAPTSSPPTVESCTETNKKLQNNENLKKHIGILLSELIIKAQESCFDTLHKGKEYTEKLSWGQNLSFEEMVDNSLSYFIKFSQDKLYFLIEILNDLVRLEIQDQNNQEHDKFQEIYYKLKNMLDKINSYPEIPKANKQIFKL